MDERICLTIDDTATISRIRWRIASSGTWPAENTLESPLECIVIQPPPLTDIEIEVTWAASRRRPRGAGRRRADARLRCERPLRERWQPAAPDDGTALYVLPACASS
jgi:hypothetical protein